MSQEQFRIVPKLLLTMTIMAGSLAVSCGVMNPDSNSAGTNETISESFIDGFAVSEKGTLELRAINGSVEVIGTEDPGIVRVWGERCATLDGTRVDEPCLDELKIMYEHRRYSLVIETVQPESVDGVSYQVHYHIRVPRTWNITVGSVNGPANVECIEGVVSLNLIQSEVALSTIRGDVAVDLTNGDVHGDVSLSTGDECEIEVTNGDIDLELSESVSAVLTASSITGSVEISDLQLHESQSARDSITGVLGDGTGIIMLRTINGAIRVSGQQ